MILKYKRMNIFAFDFAYQVHNYKIEKIIYKKSKKQKKHKII